MLMYNFEAFFHIFIKFKNKEEIIIIVTIKLYFMLVQQITANYLIVIKNYYVLYKYIYICIFLSLL